MKNKKEEINTNMDTKDWDSIDFGFHIHTVNIMVRNAG